MRRRVNTFRCCLRPGSRWPSLGRHPTDFAQLRLGHGHDVCNTAHPRRAVRLLGPCVADAVGVSANWQRPEPLLPRYALRFAHTPRLACPTRLIVCDAIDTRQVYNKTRARWSTRTRTVVSFECTLVRHDGGDWVHVAVGVQGCGRARCRVGFEMQGEGVWVPQQCVVRGSCQGADNALLPLYMQVSAIGNCCVRQCRGMAWRPSTAATTALAGPPTVRLAGFVLEIGRGNSGHIGNNRKFFACLV